VSIAAVLQENVAAHADRHALVYASDPAQAAGDVSMSYRELDLAARRLAVWLRERVPAGERAMLLYPPGLAFGVAFAGCLYAGLIAVPVSLPAGTPQRDRRATGIARDADVAVVLTATTSLAGVTAWRDAAGLADVPCVATDLIAAPGATEGDETQWTVQPVAPETPMMLQYTSGSTSDPKGVIISHGNVLSQVEMSRQVMGVGDHTRFGGWLPMHHDLGLVAQLLQPLVLGATSVFMSPFEFLKRPVRWLQLIQRHRVECSLAPHFAYEVCARHVSDSQAAALDLSGWHVAGVGAEVVRAQTLYAFAERFAPAGFRREALTPGYGLAEVTAYATVTPRATAPLVRAVDADRLERNEFVPVPADGDGGTPLIVSSGVPCRMEVRIVDPASAQPLADGQVGEVWLRGPGVALGYWGAARATLDAFKATLATGDSGFLRTGDLGVLHEGELYVTGRLKDLLIVRGRNLHPQDLEYEIRSLHEALNGRYGAVFAVSGPTGEEHVVFTQECSGELAGDRERLAEVTALVRDWSVRDIGFRPAAVVLLRPGGVSRTASGKVQRALMREHFMSGALDVMYEELDPGLRRLYR
jgi:acyl-CoA synthetase (AMP-forming)/AMP-acid ligase II